MIPGRVTAVIGGQYGSEGKGALVAHLASQYDVHVRTGGPNAGHTIWHADESWKMRQVPCGWVNYDADLVIGAGAVIDVDLLYHEINMLEAEGYDVVDRIWVDKKAAVVLDNHRRNEGGVDGEMHRKIGSTGEGVGLTRMARIARRCSSWSIVDQYQSAEDGWGGSIHDTVWMLDQWIEQGRNVLLEGTQGAGLSLIHGTWPYVTSADTNVATLLADTGIAPARLTDVILVLRTFPIRVAGNSGPLLGEMRWKDLEVMPEFTTVTKKERRVGTFDHIQVQRAITLNQPSAIALMFLDYVSPDDAEVEEFADLSENGKAYLRSMQLALGVDIRYVGTGPKTIVDVGEGDLG